MESMSFKHGVHRISWVPIIACIAASLFMIALFFIVGFHVSFEKTAIVPKKQCYKILKQRMGRHNLQKIYAFYWVYLERPKQLHDQIIQQ